jgi:ATP-binding cassette, subfamily B, multidrug efflux pump
MSKQNKKAVSGKAVDFVILKRIFTYVKPYRGIFVTAVCTTISLSLLGIIRPYMVKHMIDTHIAGSNVMMLGYMTIALVAVLILEALVQFGDSFLTNKLGQNILKDMRIQLYKHILNLRLKYYDNTPIGTLVTRAVSDMEVIGDIFSEGLIVITGDILKLVAILFVMLYLDYQLTLICLISIPFLLLATYLFKRSVSASFQEVRTQVARLNAFVQEHITGMNIVQIFNREQAEFEKFDAINKKHRDANIRSIMAYSIFFPVVEILSSVSVGLLIWWGGKELLAEETTKGDLVAFIMFLNMMFRPIRQLADRFNTLQMGMVSSERVFKVLDTEEFISTDGTKTAVHISGAIEFKDVWFAYLSDETSVKLGLSDETSVKSGLSTVASAQVGSSVVALAKTEGPPTAIDTTPWILKGISFSVEKGQTIALVGATGAGKSSIINLLNRFYEYNKGTISIDGTNIRDYELSSLRKNIGVVLQDVFLFSDTLANNITLNNPAITREQIITAAKIVGAHDFISALPNGYDYNAMERGGMLSVGQRQLISFIRAYVYDPKILILDEATSSIDTVSEKLIQHATEILTKGRTSIIIAHRLATIQKADKIIVMDKGQIVEMGNHQELLKMNGQYKRLFDLQFKEEIQEKI